MTTFTDASKYHLVPRAILLLKMSIIFHLVHRIPLVISKFVTEINCNAKKQSSTNWIIVFRIYCWSVQSVDC